MVSVDLFFSFFGGVGGAVFQCFLGQQIYYFKYMYKFVDIFFLYKQYNFFVHRKSKEAEEGIWWVARWPLNDFIWLFVPLSLKFWELLLWPCVKIKPYKIKRITLSVLPLSVWLSIFVVTQKYNLISFQHNIINFV